MSANPAETRRTVLHRGSYTVWSAHLAFEIILQIRPQIRHSTFQNAKTTRHSAAQDKLVERSDKRRRKLGRTSPRSSLGERSKTQQRTASRSSSSTGRSPEPHSTARSPLWQIKTTQSPSQYTTREGVVSEESGEVRHSRESNTNDVKTALIVTERHRPVAPSRKFNDDLLMALSMALSPGLAE
ncbi:hypothetical protein TELCIR_05999 [Teladorsagia circumcincta]|uniref:Uncharacterized protein n=1 Tax=Teladorsagia circumcincta TaxID=45464 RepID=A0A2G9UP55_TELCI|nr:hypothetical protein TELCIR_05999 [Teladorsagia circumcincta]